MKIWSMYDPATGLFLGRTFAATEDSHVATNTADHEVAIEGSFDHLSHRVDLATGAVVDYQPPQPSSDHEWNAASKRWQLTAAVAAKQAARAAALGQIAMLEASQHRAVREAALGDPAAAATLKAIDDQIKALRAQL